MSRNRTRKLKTLWQSLRKNSKCSQGRCGDLLLIKTGLNHRQKASAIHRQMETYKLLSHKTAVGIMKMQPVWSCKRCQNLLKVRSWSDIQTASQMKRYSRKQKRELFKTCMETCRMRWALEQVVYSDAITKCPQHRIYMVSWWKKYN